MGKKKVETVMVTVRLPKDLVMLTKLDATISNLTMQEVVQAALLKYLGPSAARVMQAIKKGAK
jgi:hypothetical protein